MLRPKPENLPIVQYDGRQKSGHESDTDGRHTVSPSLPGGVPVSCRGVPARRHSGSVLVTTVMGFKRIGLAFAALVVIGLGAIGVSSFLISTDTAREAVKAQIHAATGLDPTIQGVVSVSLFPPDTVTLRDVALEDAHHAPMLTATSLVAHLRLLPLLTGRIEVA